MRLASIGRSVHGRRGRIGFTVAIVVLAVAFVFVQLTGSAPAAADPSASGRIAFESHGTPAGTAANSDVSRATSTPMGTVTATPAPTTTAPPTATPSPSAPPAGPATTPPATPSIRPASTPAVRLTATPKPTLAPTATPKPTVAPTAPPVGSCPIFPASNAWNRDISALPRAANSDAMIAAIGLSSGLHPDFSATGYGIPYNVVGAATPKVSVAFDYADESDPGPYPIPANPKIEGGSDAHLLMLDTAECRLYELYAAQHTTGGWTAGSGAIFDLRSNALRPAGWTSADAAGLPIYPGLARYDEVARGAIMHALRFTAPSTCAGYIAPATHQAGSGSCSVKPPMGLRVRLKSTVDISRFGPQSQVVLRALQRYGMLLADNGSPWYVTGAPDSRWNDNDLHALGQIKGSDFEVVAAGG